MAFDTTKYDTIDKRWPSCCICTVRGWSWLFCPPSIAPACTGDHQGTVGRYLMDLYHLRVAILSNHRVAIVISLTLIIPSCVDSLSISKSQCDKYVMNLALCPSLGAM
ncbi:hypothetical protein SLA2020_030900 [Shorea laevis]